MDDTKVTVVREAHGLIKNLAKESNDKETGGILVGQYDPKGFYLVQKAIGPGPNAVRTATRSRKILSIVRIS